MNRSESTGVLSIDCHVHTADSYDSTATVEAVVQQSEKAGLDGFVVTDHDRIERSRRAATRASDFGLIGITGVEVSTMEGHLLAIGVTSRPTPGRRSSAKESHLSRPMWHGQRRKTSSPRCMPANPERWTPNLVTAISRETSGECSSAGKRVIL